MEVIVTHGSLLTMKTSPFFVAMLGPNEIAVMTSVTDYDNITTGLCA